MSLTSKLPWWLGTEATSSTQSSSTAATCFQPVTTIGSHRSARLHNAQAAALERLIALSEDRRDYHAAIVYARRLLDHNPDSEASYRYLMRLHALNGDRAAALHTYHTCVTVLQRALGVPPDAATIALHQHLLDADGAGIAPEAPPADVVFPLVGRKAEWAQLQAAWRRACAGRPHDELLTEFDLGPLDAQGTANLAGHVLGRPLEPALIDPLFQGSEGNPLFVEEMMRAG